MAASSGIASQEETFDVDSALDDLLLFLEEGVNVPSKEDVMVNTPERCIEDNSSEPSSSTGTRRMSQGLTGSSGVPVYDHDQGDSDSVVPTTPKLPLHRRNDGFAEAVSSPQVPSSQDRSVFGSSQGSSGAPDLIVTSSNSGLQGQEGMDRTAVDVQQVNNTT